MGRLSPRRRSDPRRRVSWSSLARLATSPIANCSPHCSISKHFAVLGFSRSDLSDDDFRRTARAGLEHYSSGSVISEQTWDEFKSCLHYMSGQFNDPASYQTLKQRLEKIDAAH